MARQENSESMAAAWNRASAAYLARRDERVEVVTYGALAPDEETMQLLGDLNGRSVVDFGCGGGHNAVACALAGADVVGIDISAVQLDYARKLAARSGADVRWRRGGANGLRQAAPAQVVLAIHVLTYIQDLDEAFVACRNALTADGRLVVAVDHPIRSCFWDQEVDDLSPAPMRPYNDESPMTWAFDANTPMHTYPRTTAAWLAAAIRADLRLLRLEEPLAPQAMRDDLWPEDSPLAPLRELPHTLIMVFTVE